MELIDRQISLQVMEAAWQAAAADHGRIVLLYGEAGIGKSVLVEEFLCRNSVHVRLLKGACDDLFTPRPLGPLYDMALEHEPRLAPLLTEPLDRAQVFTAFLNELKICPTIVVIEDIHWADEASMDMLKYLGRRIHHTHSILILTYRNDELGPQHPLRLLLGVLATSPAVQRIELHPLSVAGVRQWIGDRPVDAEKLHWKTGGNPFYLAEALATDDDGIPSTVRDAVLARVARLSLSGRAVLNAAAVIGPRVNPWLLNDVVQAEAEAVNESLDLGILLAHGDTLMFRHELTRQAVLDAIPPHQRTFLHQSVLDALRVSPIGRKDVARLAHHAEAAGDREAILMYARAAGQEAAALGMYRAAATQFSLAILYAEDLPPAEQMELYEGLALCTQGEPGKQTAIAARRRAVELARQAGLPVREGYNLSSLSTLLDMIDEVEESARVLDEALAVLEPIAPNRGLVDAYKNLAHQNLKRGESRTAVAYAEKSYQMAEWTERIDILVGARQMVGLCWLTLDHEVGCEHLEAALDMALKHGDFWTAGSIYPNLTMIRTDVFDLSRAEQLASAGLEFTTEHDMDIAWQVLQGWQAMIHLYRGRWAEAETQAMRLLEMSTVHPYALTPSRLAMGRLQARRGDADAAQFLDAALAGLLKSGNSQRVAAAYAARAEARWLAGDYVGMLTEVDAAYDVAVESRQPAFAAELAYWRWQAGVHSEPFEWMTRPFVLEIRGEWRAAAAAWESIDCPYEQARALAAGDEDAQLRALRIFEQLGARPMCEHLRARLRQAGVQTLPRGPRQTTRQNRFGLTNRQVEILSLLVENLTNAEIAARLHISAKTVDHHVSAVLGKLQVTSREEAAALAQERLDL